MVPNPMTGVLTRTGGDTWDKDHVTAEAEPGMMQPQAKKCQGLPATPEAWGEA